MEISEISEESLISEMNPPVARERAGEGELSLDADEPYGGHDTDEGHHGKG